MAGSRKGERRGGAKPSFQPKTGKIRAQVLATKPKRGRVEGSQNLITGEKEREMVEIITGRTELMPKHVQLQTMRTLFDLAHEYQMMMKGAMRMTPGPQLPQERIDSTLSFAERKMTEYLMLSSQVARDAAPFFHPRLAALAVTTDRNETRDLFDILLEEIDQGPRLRAIEHRKNETEAA